MVREEIGRASLIRGECVATMRALAEQGVQVDSIVTDPPYHLASIVRRFGKPGAAPPLSNGATGVFRRASAGFLGKCWDGGDVAFQPDTWRAAFDLLPPGGHLIAFAQPAKYHRMACAVEDAGFEIRDQLGWLFSSGMPKSKDVALMLDKAAGYGNRGRAVPHASAAAPNGEPLTPHPVGPYEPRTAAALAWRGWGTGLKPAWESLVLARKPLRGTIAANVTAYGAGGINIDACRLPADADGAADLGRWPANIAHDGSAEVEDAFAPFGDAGGSASRFFLCGKASRAEREGQHPTQKPLSLAAWLVRLVTPPGGLTLDPFAGSGAIPAAAVLAGFRAIAIEREADYADDAARRLAALIGAEGPAPPAEAGKGRRRRQAATADLFAAQAVPA